MPKHKPSALSRHNQHQQQQFEQIMSIANLMALSHFSKMAMRTQRWRNRTLDKIDRRVNTGESPSRWLWIKHDLLSWLHHKYHHASIHSDGEGFTSLFFSLLLGVAYTLLLTSLYGLLFLGIIWMLPHAIDWFFSIP